MEGEVEKLREENADLIADVETLKEWSEDLHKLVKIINRDFENCLMTSTTRITSFSREQITRTTVMCFKLQFV